MSIIDLLLSIPPQWRDLGIVAFVLSVIQVIPIKINPWSWVKAFFMMPHRMAEIEKRMNGVEEKNEENMAIQARVRILRFADEIRNNHQRGEESYEQTLYDIDRYKRYCDKHPDFKNEKSVSAIHFIREEYNKRIRTNNFIDQEGDEDVAGVGD